MAEKRIIGRSPGDKVEGDRLIIQCRKHDKWKKVRGSGQHHYFSIVARMNASAIVDKTFKNLQK